ncbi:MAG: FHA domain-containing protein [Pseudomonadota bacterium]
MSNTYFVEIINHHGDVQTRYKFSSLPIRIGRAYHNDIILDDPHTAAEHASIEANEAGVLMMRDLDSHNGIFVKNKRLTFFSVDSDALYRLGQTQIRIRTQDYIVAPENTHAIDRRWEGWPLAIASLVIISLLAMSTTWLGDVDNRKSTTYVMNLCVWLGFSVVWAGVWTLANRVFGGSTHFNRHLFTLSASLAVLYLWGYLTLYLAYGFSWEIFTRYGSHVEITIIAVMVYFHLRQITPRKHHRLKIICAALALFSSGMMLMRNHQHTNQYTDELYMHDILPPSVRKSHNHSLSEFDEAISQLKIKIDKERKDALEDKKL